MVTAKVFMSGDSQAVRIPNEFRTEQKEFYIRQFGEGFYLIPTSDPWYLLKNSIGQGTDIDYDREQPKLSGITEREEF